jgi:hypothetical protein
MVEMHPGGESRTQSQYRPRGGSERRRPSRIPCGALHTGWRIGQRSVGDIHLWEFRQHRLGVHFQCGSILSDKISGEQNAWEAFKILLLDGLEIALGNLGLAGDIVEGEILAESLLP